MRHALLLALVSTAHAQAGGEVPRDRGEPDGPASHSRANGAIAGDLAVGLARVCVAECGLATARLRRRGQRVLGAAVIAVALLVGWALGALSIVIALALVAWWLSAEGEAWDRKHNRRDR